jgi:phage FluMu protein Com
MPRPWWMVGRLQVGGNPFMSLDLDWCPRCKSEEDTDTDAEYGDGVYVYRRRCRRCGKVIKFGAFQIPLVSNKPMPPAVFEWVTEPGKDRR